MTNTWNTDAAIECSGWEPDGPPEIVVETDRTVPVVGPGPWDIEWVPRVRYRQRWQRVTSEIIYTEWTE
jgi:hypothetical protein